MTAQASSSRPARLPGSISLQRPVPLLKAMDIAYLLFEKPDLELCERFALDFGFQRAARTDETLYLRGTGPNPWFYAATRGPVSRFVGVGFSVQTRAELETLAAQPGASSIQTIEGPGGGERVSLTDPNGWRVDFVFGRKPQALLPTRQEAFLPNTPFQKGRINQTVRPELQPTPVYRLGHVVLQVPDFETSAAWYLRHLGLIPTDVQCLHDGSPALAFLRLDLGTTPADHHTVVIAAGFKAAYLHSAYEALDLDAIGQGQQVLLDRGWKHVWGIGRHQLGSQIFDYWSDPWGQEMEHYADGDVFDASHPTGYVPLDRASLWMWGDNVPSHFKPSLSLRMVIEIVRNIRRGVLKRDILPKLKRAYETPPRRWLP